FYYLRVIKVMYFDQPEDNDMPAQRDPQLRFLLVVNAVALLLLGIFLNPLAALCKQAFGLAS
ncbi:MAG: NADH:ubiquinone oxidoreductase subunit N, partial [Xanthomonadales bacterium]|nr:NADH:ubiquinone oxidoreductase subunit N [Xanthomonadales bacterium]